MFVLADSYWWLVEPSFRARKLVGPEVAGHDFRLETEAHDVIVVSFTRSC